MGLITKDEQGNVAYSISVKDKELELPPEGIHIINVVPSSEDFTKDFGKTAGIVIDKHSINSGMTKIERNIDNLTFSEGVSTIILNGLTYPDVRLKKITLPSTTYNFKINPKAFGTDKNSDLQEIDFSKVIKGGWTLCDFTCGTLRYLNCLETLDLSKVKVQHFEKGCITSLPRLRTLAIHPMSLIDSHAFQYLGKVTPTNIFLESVDLNVHWVDCSNIDNLILGHGVTFNSPQDFVPEYFNVEINKIWIDAANLVKFLVKEDNTAFFLKGSFNSTSGGSFFKELVVVDFVPGGPNINKLLDNRWLLPPYRDPNRVNWVNCLKYKTAINFDFTVSYIKYDTSAKKHAKKWNEDLLKCSLNNKEMKITGAREYDPDLPWG